MARSRWRRGLSRGPDHGLENRDRGRDGSDAESSPRVDHLRRGVYILPTLITLTNFACGFISITHALDGRFVAAAYMIIYAMIADALDGAVARITRTESSFGTQLDSLADIVSFGCAPAILIHLRFGLSVHPFWIFPLFFSIAGALRLARYNAVDTATDAHDFRGTPIPAPAGVVAGLILALEKNDMNFDRFLVTMIVFLLSYLMICNIRYPSFKMILRPDQPRPFRSLVILLLVIVLLLTHFVGTWLILASIYYASGPYLGIRNWFRKRREDEVRNDAESVGGPSTT